MIEDCVNCLKFWFVRGSKFDSVTTNLQGAKNSGL